ncbi:MAG: toll/interleukin-1 receptor domain-containing protein [Proteobacteria bacterium]|nr:toll/interleukin-1 receptor domain-containing protein [Pseudomonadota bacterium]
MKVFISWSGARSKAVAQALHRWLPMVLHYVEPWHSGADIGAGERWADAVSKELEAANFGIICLTPENLDAPWVLFEAGALAKSMQESRVIPLLLDLEVSDITYPLAQFQTKKLDQSGVREVVKSINDAAESADSDTRMQDLFGLLWPNFEEALAAIPASSSPATRTRPQPEILEDLVARVRALDAHIREVPEVSQGGVKYVEHIYAAPDLADIRDSVNRIPATDSDDPAMIMRIAEVFLERNSAVFHAGVDAYQAARDNDFRSVLRKLSVFRRAIASATRTPDLAAQHGLETAMVKLIRQNLGKLFSYYGPLAQAAKDAGAEEAPPNE